MDREKLFLYAALAVCAALLLVALLVRPSSDAGEPAMSRAGIADEGRTGGPGAGGQEGTAAAGVEGEGGEAAGEEGGGAPGEEGGEAAGEEGGGAPGEAAAVPGQGAPSFLSEQNRRQVVLFFQEARGELLGPERREIFMTASPADQAKQIVVELINGPRSGRLLPTLPPETRLLGLYIDRWGTAYVDLSEEVVAFHPGGSAEELATIFSLVDSLTYNLPEIKRVRILIGGEERQTLKNHLDLRRDYVQDLSIVSRAP
ncbi:MAG: GerMN domain-containing protein [Acidobacteriota bacterium]